MLDLLKFVGYSSEEWELLTDSLKFYTDVLDSIQKNESCYSRKLYIDVLDTLQKIVRRILL